MTFLSPNQQCQKFDFKLQNYIWLSTSVSASTIEGTFDILIYIVFLIHHRVRAVPVNIHTTQVDDNKFHKIV